MVTSVIWSGVKAQEIDFTVQGKNFQADPLVLIAQYAPAGGWTYLATSKTSEPYRHPIGGSLRGSACE